MFQKVPPPIRTNNNGKRKVLRFGDLVAAVYESCGKTSANGILRLAVNARLVEFLGRRRFMIVEKQN